MGANARPAIPEELKRRVRAHCGFGCAICATMPTQIEHIEPYSSVRSHDFENLVLLCANCHQDVTSGRTAKRQVRDARSNPASRKNQTALYSPQFSSQYVIEFATLRLEPQPGAVFFPFNILGERPVAIQLGDVPRFSLRLRDRSGSVSLSMTDNTLDFTPSRLWDVRLTGQSLKVSYGLRKIALGISIVASNLSVNQLRLVCNGFPIVSDRNGIQFPYKTARISGGTYKLSGKSPMSLFSTYESDPDPMFLLDSAPTTSHQEAWDCAMRHGTQSV